MLVSSDIGLKYKILKLMELRGETNNLQLSGKLRNLQNKQSKHREKHMEDLNTRLHKLHQIDLCEDKCLPFSNTRGNFTEIVLL